MFALNLSFISHPCVLTAAIVVSEIIERLSPNIAPHTTAPMQILSANPVFSLIPTAIGASAAIVPMEVPIETEIKHPIRNRPATAKCAGINDNPKLTVLSTPPAAVTAPEKTSGAEKDQAHRNDVFLTNTFGNHFNLLVKTQFFILQKCNKQCDQKTQRSPASHKNL